MKRLQHICSYLRYLFNAKSKHYAQAPFLYSFITKVLHSKIKNKDLKDISRLRKILSESEKFITTTDFGAGSNINNSKKRKVKDIAKNSAKNLKFGSLLYRICSFYRPKNIIELGTSLGISTCYLAKADPDSKVFTFEGCKETASLARKNFYKLELENINVTIGDFNDTLSSKLEYINHIDLAFIDGNHKEKPTISYFEKILEYSGNDTIFIFDDIHWSKGMEKAWDYIKAHHKTTLTIDLFFIGIVFLKSELSKEDFVLRF